MLVAMRAISAGLALDEDSSAIHQVPGGFEVRKERRGPECKREIKGRGEEMTRSTGGGQPLS